MQRRLLSTCDTSADGQRCPAVKRNGQPCGGRVTASGYCFAHGPDAATARAKGGAATSNANRAAKLLPSRLRPIVDRLEQAFYEVHVGELDARTAVAMASVASAIGRLVALGEYEERLRALEASAARVVDAVQTTEGGM